jgi:hypothetical protein
MLSFSEAIFVATVAPLLSLGLAALIGHRLSATWAERQKKRELELALAGSFYSSYGHFCSIWKEWNFYHTEIKGLNDALFEEKRLQLLEMACRAEGEMEAVLLKIASERVLSNAEAANLGELRQAYQVARERIEEYKKISYGRSGHNDYLEFKRLATFLGTLLAQSAARRPNEVEAYESFKEITDNRHEARWRNAGGSD